MSEVDSKVYLSFFFHCIGVDPLGIFGNAVMGVADLVDPGSKPFEDEMAEKTEQILAGMDVLKVTLSNKSI